MQRLTQRLLVPAALAALGAAAVVHEAGSEPRLPPAALRARADDTPVDSKLIAADNAFGVRLFSTLAREEGEQNTFISPTSAALALAMAYNGAEGQTKEQMATALALQGMSLDEVNRANAALLAQLSDIDPKVRLLIANSLWITRRGEMAAKPDFLRRNQEYYGAEVGDLKGAPQTVNAWVRKETEGKIDSIVNASDLANVAAILVNAVYFKGQWAHPFDKSVTHNAVFTTDEGVKRDVPMMHSSVNCPYLRGDSFQAISLPYGAGRARALIFLPNAGTRLSDLMTKVTPENWSRWTRMFQPAEGSVALPRFRSEYEADLGRPLTNLGMGIAFRPGLADFSGMAGRPHAIWIGKARQKTYLEVNEEGTEAAAATGIVMTRKSVRLHRGFDLNFDRPFLFAIQDSKTDTILFLGAIRDLK